MAMLFDAQMEADCYRNWIGEELRRLLSHGALQLEHGVQLLNRSAAQDIGLILAEGEAGCLVAARRAFALDSDAFELVSTALAEGISDGLPLRALRRLSAFVFEGAIRVENGQTCISGPLRTLERLPPLAATEVVAPTAIRNIELSRDAIRMASSWRSTLGADLSSELYRFGTVPKVGLNARLPDALQIAASDLIGFRPIANRYWYSFNAACPDVGGGEPSDQRRNSDTDPGLRSKVCVKLFVAPLDAAALHRVLGILDPRVVQGFKFPKDVGAFARPDFFVVYLQDPSCLKTVQESILDVLDGMEGRGVPFSAAFDAGGLVSWGIDPPGGANAGSHRSIIADSVAKAIDDATAFSPSQPQRAYDHIEWRLILDGYALHGCLPLEDTEHVHG